MTFIFKILLFMTVLFSKPAVAGVPQDYAGDVVQQPSDVHF